MTAHFNTQQIMEIIFTVGLDQMISRFHAAVRTDVDESTLELVAPTCPVRLPPLPVESALPVESESPLPIAGD